MKFIPAFSKMLVEIIKAEKPSTLIYVPSEFDTDWIRAKIISVGPTAGMVQGAMGLAADAKVVEQFKPGDVILVNKKHVIEHEISANPRVVVNLIEDKYVAAKVQ